MKLKIADGLSLPLEAVTQTFGLLAKRGSGKTYTALVLVEEMLKAGQAVVVADPVGVAWGLRGSADGKSEGLPITVLGGDHGDVPLEASAGETIATLVVEERLPVVLDLSLFRKGEQVRFMTDFCERLYQLKGRQQYRDPLHLVLDEADAFAPQKTYRGQERMLGAVEDLVRRGRARGIGVTLVTQRPAVLNKDVLTQVEVLVVLRLIGPQDVKAIDAWIELHGTPAQREELVASLPSLPIGTAWFWSPGWLDVFRKVQVRERETFDSSATPKVGQKARAPKKLAPVDLERLRKHIASTIERAKADDPKALRARVTQLERELATTKRAAPAPAVEKVIERVEVPVLKADQVKRLEKAAYAIEKTVVRLTDELPGLAHGFQEVCGELVRALHNGARTVQARATRVVRPVAPGEGEFTPSGPQQRILDALAWLETIGISPATKVAAAFLAGYRPNGGAFKNPLGNLRTNDCIAYPQPGTIALTDKGRAFVHVPELPLSVAELHRMVLERLPGPEIRILKPLLEAYPESVAKDELAAAAGYAQGGAFNNPLGRLRSMGLVDYPEPGRVVALPVLFLEAR